MVWPLALGLNSPTLRCGPLSWGYGLTHFGVAPRVGVMDDYTSVWPVELGLWELGLWTTTRRCGPLSWGYGLPRFGETQGSESKRAVGFLFTTIITKGLYDEFKFDGAWTCSCKTVHQE